MTGRRMLAGLAGLAALVVGAAAWAVLRPSVDGPSRAAVDRFFDRYVTDDGRVRRDEGDTVSEGQAYALLMAVATDDRRRFARVWEWTRRHLLRPDGVMAWLWDEGVVDEGLAPDADVDAAVALLMAADRFDEPAYGRAGQEMAEAVLDHATVRVDGDVHLTAGEWATRSKATVLNPSYLDPASFRYLQQRTGDPRWAELAGSARRVLARSMGERLPSDWLLLESDGSVGAVAAPDRRNAPGQFGFDALRVPIRLATDCTAELLRDLEPVWPRVAEDPGAAIRRRDGRPKVDWEHAAAYVSAAALAETFRPERVDDLLQRAAATDRRHPSYYGAAWVALGRLLLTTSTLERCP